MKRGGVGGGSTKTGLVFEAKTDLATAIGRMPGYHVTGNVAYEGPVAVGRLYQKYALYSGLLRPKGVDARKVISKLLLPDDALLSLKTNELHIMEKKFQAVAGSVDEKLQTCDFKLRQYRKLVKPIGIMVTYTYVLNAWFLQEAYRDVLAYIEDVGARYYFDVVPHDVLGI